MSSDDESSSASSGADEVLTCKHCKKTVEELAGGKHKNPRNYLRAHRQTCASNPSKRVNCKRTAAQERKYRQYRKTKTKCPVPGCCAEFTRYHLSSHLKDFHGASAWYHNNYHKAGKRFTKRVQPLKPGDAGYKQNDDDDDDAGEEEDDNSSSSCSSTAIKKPRSTNKNNNTKKSVKEDHAGRAASSEAATDSDDSDDSNNSCNSSSGVDDNDDDDDDDDDNSSDPYDSDWEIEEWEEEEEQNEEDEGVENRNGGEYDANGPVVMRVQSQRDVLVCQRPDHNDDDDDSDDDSSMPDPDNPDQTDFRAIARANPHIWEELHLEKKLEVDELLLRTDNVPRSAAEAAAVKFVNEENRIAGIMPPESILSYVLRSDAAVPQNPNNVACCLVAEDRTSNSRSNNTNTAISVARLNARFSVPGASRQELASVPHGTGPRPVVSDQFLLFSSSLLQAFNISTNGASISSSSHVPSSLLQQLQQQQRNPNSSGPALSPSIRPPLGLSLLSIAADTRRVEQRFAEKYSEAQRCVEHSLKEVSQVDLRIRSAPSIIDVAEELRVLQSSILVRRGWTVLVTDDTTNGATTTTSAAAPNTTTNNNNSSKNNNGSKSGNNNSGNTSGNIKNNNNSTPPTGNRPKQSAASVVKKILKKSADNVRYSPAVRFFFMFWRRWWPESFIVKTIEEYFTNNSHLFTTNICPDFPLLGGNPNFPMELPTYCANLTPQQDVHVAISIHDLLSAKSATSGRYRAPLFPLLDSVPPLLRFVSIAAAVASDDSKEGTPATTPKCETDLFDIARFLRVYCGARVAEINRFIDRPSFGGAPTIEDIAQLEDHLQHVARSAKTAPVQLFFAHSKPVEENITRFIARVEKRRDADPEKQALLQLQVSRRVAVRGGSDRDDSASSSTTAVDTSSAHHDLLLDALYQQIHQANNRLETAFGRALRPIPSAMIPNNNNNNNNHNNDAARSMQQQPLYHHLTPQLRTAGEIAFAGSSILFGEGTRNEQNRHFSLTALPHDVYIDYGFDLRGPSRDPRLLPQLRQLWERDHPRYSEMLRVRYSLSKNPQWTPLDFFVLAMRSLQNKKTTSVSADGNNENNNSDNRSLNKNKNNNSSGAAAAAASHAFSSVFSLSSTTLPPSSASLCELLKDVDFTCPMLHLRWQHELLRIGYIFNAAFQCSKNHVATSGLVLELHERQIAVDMYKFRFLDPPVREMEPMKPIVLVRPLAAAAAAAVPASALYRIPFGAHAAAAINISTNKPVAQRRGRDDDINNKSSGGAEMMTTSAAAFSAAEQEDNEQDPFRSIIGK